jgi:hypothetical protein
MTEKELIEEALVLFPESYRPDHFTNHNHCEECRDHDKTLLAHTRENISYEELGNPAWDPICFVNEDGFKYYFPALIRLALAGTGKDYYIDQFLFHITQNSSCKPFSREQSGFVVKVLEYLLENKTDEIDNCLDTDDIFNAIDLWTERKNIAN